VLTPCPPGPEAQKVSTRRSLSATSTSTSSASGRTAALVLQAAVGPLALDDRRHFLEAAGLGLGEVEDLHPPALTLGVAAVHAEELAGEERRLVAAGAGADLEHDVSLVVGILGRELDAQLLLQRRLAFGEPGALLLRQGVELVAALEAGEHLVGRAPLAIGLLPVAVAAHDLGDLGQRLAGVAVGLAVRQDLRPRELLLQLVVGLLDLSQLVEHRVRSRLSDAPRT